MLQVEVGWAFTILQSCTQISDMEDNNGSKESNDEGTSLRASIIPRWILPQRASMDKDQY